MGKERTFAKAVVIEALLTQGWEADGETQREVRRMPTSGTHYCGRSLVGGREAAFGGRPRFRKGDRFVTVGPRTTFFWTKGPGGAITDPKHIKTVDAMAALITNAPGAGEKGKEA